jgi:hypothetical protein
MKRVRDGQWKVFLEMKEERKKCTNSYQVLYNQNINRKRAKRYCIAQLIIKIVLSIRSKGYKKAKNKSYEHYEQHITR